MIYSKNDGLNSRRTDRNRRNHNEENVSSSIDGTVFFHGFAGYAGTSPYRIWSCCLPRNLRWNERFLDQGKRDADFKGGKGNFGGQQRGYSIPGWDVYNNSICRWLFAARCAWRRRSRIRKHNVWNLEWRSRGASQWLRIEQRIWFHLLCSVYLNH